MWGETNLKGQGPKEDREVTKRTSDKKINGKVGTPFPFAGTVPTPSSLGQYKLSFFRRKKDFGKGKRLQDKSQSLLVF